MKEIKVSSQEQSIIENALNAYWNDAAHQLEEKGTRMGNGELRQLGDIERAMLIKRKELTLPILRRFENLY